MAILKGGGKMLITEGIDRFIKSIEVERNLSLKTRKAYLCDLRLFENWFGRADYINKISTDTIRSYLVYINNGLHYQGTTVRRKISVLRNFFSYLEDEDLITKSPMRKIKTRFRVQQKLPRVLSLEEARIFLSIPLLEKQKVETGNMGNSVNMSRQMKAKIERVIRDRAIIELLFATGMRIGELVGLNVDDIDMERGTALVLGKGDKERIVYFCSKATKNALKEYLDIRMRIGNEPKAFFLNRFDTRLSATSIEKLFRNYQQKTGITKRVTPHSMRHTMATMLLDNGADIRVVQEILGHASISTTQIYTNVSLERKKEAMEKYNHRDKIKLLWTEPSE